MKSFFGLLAQKTNYLVIAHNTKIDAGIIYSNFGILLKNLYCTMIASQVIDNGYKDSKNMVGGIGGISSPHSLIGVTKRYLGKDIGSNKEEIRSSFIGMKPGTPLTQEQLEYAASDTSYLYDIYLEQQKYIEERNLQAIIKLENAVTPVLIKMELRGCLLDQEKHKKNIDNWKKKKNEVENKLDSIIINLAKSYPTLQGGKFTNERKREELIQLDLFGGEGYLVKNLNVYNINYSSSKQIEDIFTRVEEPMPVDDNGKISFGENPIKIYLNNYPNSPMSEFLQTLLEFREYDKLLGTYGAKLLTVLDHTGRIRTNYGQCWTATGRLNSAAVIKDELGTNLANIPANNDVRNVFIPDPGYSFVDIDMTGQELSLAGDFSKEPIILKAFNEGFDLHSYLSSKSYSIIFKRKVEVKNENTKIEIEGYEYNLEKLRNDHKAALFSKIYLGGPRRIQTILNKYLVNHWDPGDRFSTAIKVSEELDKSIPILTKYLKGKVNEVKKNGFVIANKLGRRRYFDDPSSAYGDSANFPIQGTGGDSIKIALIQIDKAIEEKAKELGVKEEEVGWLTMSIYDQVLISLNNKYLDLADKFKEIVSNSLTYFLTTLKGSSDMVIRTEWAK